MQLRNNKGVLVRWYGSFGFIRFEDRNVFVHLKNYLHGFRPEVGSMVAFDFGPSPNPHRPAQAKNVRVVKSAAAIRAEKEVLDALTKQHGGLDTLARGTQDAKYGVQ